MIRAIIKRDAKGASSSLDVINIAQKYQCTVCGYIYDPEVGDPDSGVKPGTAFEDLPKDWVCPSCGASKDEFKKV